MQRWGLLPLLLWLAGCATGTPVGLHSAGSSIRHHHFAAPRPSANEARAASPTVQTRALTVEAGSGPPSLERVDPALTDAVLRHCPYYSLEILLRDLDRVWKLLEPSLAALASREPGAVEATALALPGLMEQLTHEYDGLRARVRHAAEVEGKALAVKELIEMLCTLSTMKLALPGPPPSAPAVLGTGLVVGSGGGVMLGSQVVVSAEWVEMMRRLVQAGVLSAATVSAAVRIHAGGMMMAQANGDLPQGVRDALGEGPEVGAMHETGKAGAGMAKPPRHHVMPQEHREWFEKRGFTGDMDIDQFCVKLEAAHHQAIHGGGNWRMGRMWPGEWNQMIMDALRKAEASTGEMLTRNEVLKIVGQRMKFYDIPMNFTSWRGR